MIYEIVVNVPTVVQVEAKSVTEACMIAKRQHKLTKEYEPTIVEVIKKGE